MFQGNNKIDCTLYNVIDGVKSILGAHPAPSVSKRVRLKLGL